MGRSDGVGEREWGCPWKLVRAIRSHTCDCMLAGWEQVGGSQPDWNRDGVRCQGRESRHSKKQRKEGRREKPRQTGWRQRREGNGSQQGLYGSLLRDPQPSLPRPGLPGGS